MDETKIEPSKFVHCLIEETIEKDDASWQYILYDLVKSKQIDPWAVDLIELTNKFLSRIEEMDRKNLYISSKVLLVAAILVKMKADILYQSLIKKEEKRSEKIEEIDLNEDYISILPKIPLQRERKITLDELVKALKNALKTEERKIRKTIKLKSVDLSFVFPQKRKSWHHRITEVYKIIIEKIKRLKTKKILFSQLINKNDREEKISFFVPIVHLDFQRKIIAQQEDFFSDIEITLNKN